MPTAMMIGLNFTISMYAENEMTFLSSINPRLTSESIISNPDRGAQHQVMPTLTTSSLLSVRQHMDESNHEMVNMLTHHIGIVLIS